MHDFIRHLSFSPFQPEGSDGGNTAGAAPSRLTTAATFHSVSGILRSFNETPAYRPTPRRRKVRQPAGSKSLSPQLSTLN